jgi:transposase
LASTKHSASYSAEFRAEAVRLARTSGKPYRQIALDLGMTTETLRKWLKQTDLDDGKRPDGLTTEEREELRQLRRLLLQPQLLPFGPRSLECCGTL